MSKERLTPTEIDTLEWWAAQKTLSQTITPWGAAIRTERLAPGILFHYTPSHGGLELHAIIQRRLPRGYEKTNFLNSRRWHEEDCDALKCQRALGFDFL